MSSWGQSWGSSWGNAWGQIASAVTAYVGPALTKKSRKKRHEDDNSEAFARDDAEVIKFIEAFMNGV